MKVAPPELSASNMMKRIWSEYNGGGCTNLNGCGIGPSVGPSPTISMTTPALPNAVAVHGGSVLPLLSPTRVKNTASTRFVKSS